MEVRTMSFARRLRLARVVAHLWAILPLPSYLFSLASFFACLASTPAHADNWPQWRGPAGTGVSQEKELPIIWSESRSVVWKTPLPEWGTSTPAIWGEAVFVTSHTSDNKLLLLRLNKKDGKTVWQQEVGSGEAPREAPQRSTQKFHELHNLASPSPVTNGEVVVAHFGNGLLAGYDFEGKQLWKHDLQEQFGAYSIWWGHANSPVIVGNAVISVCMQDSLADLREKPVASYLVAHQIHSGRELWRTSRETGAEGEQGDAYTTPVLYDAGGAKQLVVMGGNQLDAYDPATGKQLWFLPNLVGGRTVTGPTIANDTIYVTRGMRGPLLAIRPNGAGELTKRSIVWDHSEGSPDTCCPVVWNELLFTVTDDGIARCFDALTGAVKWKHRINGKFKASPVAVEGRVFFLNTEGLCTVVSARPRFDQLVENQLDDQTLASPAISDGRFYIRGKKALYCIGR